MDYQKIPLKIHHTKTVILMLAEPFSGPSRKTHIAENNFLTRLQYPKKMWAWHFDSSRTLIKGRMVEAEWLQYWSYTCSMFVWCPEGTALQSYDGISSSHLWSRLIHTVCGLKHRHMPVCNQTMVFSSPRLIYITQGLYCHLDIESYNTDNVWLPTWTKAKIFWQ